MHTEKNWMKELWGSLLFNPVSPQNYTGS